jgi:hypothetical protein
MHCTFNCGHLLHIRVDHVELKSKIQGNKSVRCGGPQASSGEDTNLTLDKGKPRCITPQSLTFIFINIFMLRMIVCWSELIGTVVTL